MVPASVPKDLRGQTALRLNTMKIQKALRAEVSFALLWQLCICAAQPVLLLIGD